MPWLIRRGGDSASVDDAYTVKVEIIGANFATGGDSRERDCSLKVDSKTVTDGDELTFAAGTEMFVDIVPGCKRVWGGYQDVYASLIEIRYVPGFHDGRCYEIGGAYNSNSDYYNTIPVTSFQYVVDGDMTLYIMFDDLWSNPQCITLTGEEQAEVTTLAGHTYSTGDTFVIDSLPSNRNPKGWTALDLNADGLVPVVTFGGYSEDDYLFEGYVYGDTIEWTTVGQLSITIEFVKPTIRLADSEILEIGGTTLLDFDVHPYDPRWTDFGIEWSSADPDIVSVDSSGNITGVSAGETTVSATVHYGNLRFTEECEVTVNAPPEYDITVISGGHGTITSSHQSATAGTEVSIGVSPETGYRLMGITATGGAVLEESVDGYTFIMPESDVVIHVEFTPLTYTVTFHNGETVHSTPTFDHGDPLVFPDPDPVKESDEEYDYRFTGWVDESENPIIEGTPVVGDLDLYASYEPSDRLYDIVFIAGDEIISYELQYGEAIVPPDDPVMDGYDFIGWDRYSPGMRVTGDMTFRAVFEKVPEPIPPYIPGDDDVWVPPNIVYEDDDEEDPWIFVVLGSTALLLFLLFFRYERRE